MGSTTNSNFTAIYQPVIRLSKLAKKYHYGLERVLGQFWRKKGFCKDQEKVLDISKMVYKGLKNWHKLYNILENKEKILKFFLTFGNWAFKNFLIHKDHSGKKGEILTGKRFF